MNCLSYFIFCVEDFGFSFFFLSGPCWHIFDPIIMKGTPSKGSLSPLKNIFLGFPNGYIKHYCLIEMYGLLLVFFFLFFSIFFFLKMVAKDFIIEAKIQYFDRFNTHCARKHIILLGFSKMYTYTLFSLYPWSRGHHLYITQLLM